MKTKYFIPFIIVLLFFASCKKENRCDCIKRTGPIIEDKRIVGEFHKIKAEDNVEVFIIQDSINEVVVKAGKNIAPLIKTTIEDGTLIIRNKNRCNWSRSYKKEISVYVKFKDLKWIINEGTSNITSLNTVLQDTLDIQTTNSGDLNLKIQSYRLLSHIFGSGDIRLSGNTYEHGCNVGGTAYMYAKELQTSYTYIDTHTIGPSEIYCSGMLICAIRRKGNVYCYGNPTSVQKIIEGSGQLILE